VRGPEPGRLERLRDEMELFGFTVTDHPLALFPDIAWDTYCPIDSLMHHAGSRVIVAGLVVADRNHRQSDGRPMKFLSLCDPTGIAECELFAPSYARFGLETIRHPVIEITADVRPFDNHNGFSLDVRRVRRARRQ
jgi:DNA polymerase III alpha subunit